MDKGFRQGESGVGGWARCDFSKYFPVPQLTVQLFRGGEVFWGGKHWKQGRHAGACIWRHLAAYEGQEMLRKGGCLTFKIAALPATHVLPPWWLLLSPSCLWGSIGKVE